MARIQQTWAPIPDPTLLTTQQLQREILATRELIQVQLESAKETVTELQAAADHIPARMDEKVDALRELHEEKFKSVSQQFDERDQRSDQAMRDSKMAVEAALQAAKEAAGKSEAALVKQIDQLDKLLQTLTQGLGEKIADLKDRLTRIEGHGEGTTTKVTGDRWAIGAGIAAAGLLVSIALGVLALFNFQGAH